MESTRLPFKGYEPVLRYVCMTAVPVTLVLLVIMGSLEHSPSAVARLVSVACLYLAYAGMAVPVACLVVAYPYLLIRAERCQAHGRTVFEAFVGPDVIHKAHEVYANNTTQHLTGVAISATHLYVVDQGVGHRIPLADVRTWTAVRERPNTLSHAQIHDNLNRLFAPDAGSLVAGATIDGAIGGVRNHNARLTAADASGLFVKVRSVEHPVVQFRTSDWPLLQRWHEILTQAREGRLAKAA